MNATAIKSAIIANRRDIMNGYSRLADAYTTCAMKLDGGFDIGRALDELAYRVSMAPDSPANRAAELAFVDSLRAMAA